MITGVNPWKLAELADRRIKASRKQLYDALHGRLTDHHRVHVGALFAAIRCLGRRDRKDRQAGRCGDCQDGRGGGGRSGPFPSLIALLCTILGIAELAARTILVEIGADMSRFPTAGHLLAWVRLCRGQYESAGWLKTPMVQCGWAAGTSTAHCLGVGVPKSFPTGLPRQAGKYRAECRHKRRGACAIGPTRT
jgi:transposase